MTIATLGMMAFQDIKDHLVWWFLFPLYAIVGGALFYIASFQEIYVQMAGLNLFILLGYIGLLFMVIRYILKKSSFFKAIGLGDVLLWIALGLSFPTITFITILVFSSLFSLVLNKIIKSNQKEGIPYAGFTAIFLIGLYITHWTGMYKNLYVL